MKSLCSGATAGILLLLVSSTCGAAVSTSPSLLANALNVVPVLGPTLVGAVGALGAGAGGVPVVGPALSALVLTPGDTDHGPLTLSGVLDGLPGLGPVLGGAVGGVGSVARGVPFAGPLFGSVIGTLTPEQMLVPSLPGLQDVTRLINGVPVVGPVLGAATSGR